jgi:hypothetical protein
MCNPIEETKLEKLNIALIEYFTWLGTLSFEEKQKNFLKLHEILQHRISVFVQLNSSPTVEILKE